VRSASIRPLSLVFLMLFPPDVFRYCQSADPLVFSGAVSYLVRMFVETGCGESLSACEISVIPLF